MPDNKSFELLSKETSFSKTGHNVSGNHESKSANKESPPLKKAKEDSTATSDHNPTHHMMRSSVKSVPKPPKRHLSDLMYIEHYENGGGYALHAYADELAHLSRDELTVLVRKYFRTLFSERRKKPFTVPFSYYCIGVIHGAAHPMPELINYLSNIHGNITVTTNPMELKNAAQTLPMKEYANKVFSSYSKGIYRHGPLHAISIVGTKGEERGTLSKDLIEMLERDPFLKAVTPWGALSKFSDMSPEESDDGPILWARPGEQAIPVRPVKSRIKTQNS